jgi:predicted metalloprotease with PDZ domain
MPFRTQSLQRLHEQLRHEMFHLWIPNGVNLSGNYDWFYEGFALYASLKMAVALNRIRFEDFVDTLTRAQAIDSHQTNRLSLLDASVKRWNGADTYVYARGMLTAFLCDVLLLHNSRGKRSLNDILREFYAKHRFPNPRMDGNTAALSILQNNRELGPIIDNYIKASGKFAWEPELLLAGLEIRNGLSVMSKLNGRQKDLLDALGYNNWRKLSK